MPLVEVHHPLIKHHLSRLRDRHTPPAEFRQVVQRLAVLLAYEATKDLSIHAIDIETPLMRITAQALSQRIALIPILRAGLGMVECRTAFSLSAPPAVDVVRVEQPKMPRQLVSLNPPLAVNKLIAPELVAA